MRLKLKKRRKRRIGSIIVILFILIMIGTLLFIKYFSDKAGPILYSYADAEVRKLTTLVINKAVTKQIASDMDVDEMFDIVKNDAGEIQLITFNSTNVTRMLNAITNLVQLNLKAIEEGNIDLLELPDNTLVGYDEDKLREGIIYEIPIGVVSNISFLNNLGPKIPVKLDFIGDVTTGVESKVTEYGLNNALLEVDINISVTSRINLPFITENVTISTNVPIAMKIIQGKVPEMYLDGITSFLEISTYFDDK